MDGARRAPLLMAEHSLLQPLPPRSVPSWLHPSIGSSNREVSMSEHSRVVIGMDPHKQSVTVEVMEADEQILGHGRFGTDVAGFAELVGFAARWPDRVWAVEGCE